MNVLIRSLVAFLLFQFSSTSGELFAAKVKIRKKTGLIRIDQGATEGFVKGEKACVLNAKLKPFACGRIVKEGKKGSYLKISRKRIRRVKKNMRVELLATIKAGLQPEEDSAENMEQAKIEEMPKKSLETPVEDADSKPDSRTNVKLGYVFTPIGPAAYKKVAFEPPSERDGALESAWVSETAPAQAFGFLMEFGFGIGEAQFMDFGLRYRAGLIGDIETNHFAIIGTEDEYVKSVSNYSSLGLYVDYGFLDIPMGTSSFFQMTGGLDIDSGTLAFKAEREDGTLISEYTSKLTVVSLKLGSHMKFHFIDPIGLTFGINALVPILGEPSGSYSGGEPTDEVVNRVGDGSAEAAEEDLKNAIDHKKSGFGVEVVIATYFSF